MNKFLIPTILTATVLIAGIFAFMPIEKASTVHFQIIGAIQDDVGPQFENLVSLVEDDPPSFDTIQIQFFSMTFGSDDDRFVLLDLHRPVSADNGGFVVIRTNADPSCDELMVVVTNVAGTILASNIMAAIPANAVLTEPDWDILCHAHIPFDPATVFVALARTPGQTPTIITDSIITTTIVSLG